MLQSAKDLEFERAAEIRDQLEQLRESVNNKKKSQSKK